MKFFGLFKVGSPCYDQERVPSWCDRVLFKGDALQCERYDSNRMINLSDHFPVYAHFTFKTAPRKDVSWAVNFEKIPRWHNTVPFMCSFRYHDNFWNLSGSYRDWIGIYKANVTNCLLPLTWLYVFACYNTKIASKSLNVAQFPCLSVGRYRVGYFSAYNNCLQGLSEVFIVDCEN